MSKHDVIAGSFKFYKRNVTSTNVTSTSFLHTAGGHGFYRTQAKKIHTETQPKARKGEMIVTHLRGRETESAIPSVPDEVCCFPALCPGAHIVHSRARH